MTQVKIWKMIWKLAAGATVLLLLAAAGLAFVNVNIGVSLTAVGLLCGWSSLIAQNKLAVNDTRTIMRQELRGFKTAPQSVSTKGIDQAAKRLETAVANLAREQSPLARELHLRTVEEIRFLQAQMASVVEATTRR